MQVFLHYSLLNEHRDVLCSTHKEHGGSGRPQPFVIGRGRRMLRGMELGVQGMLGAGCLGSVDCYKGAGGKSCAGVVKEVVPVLQR